ncbi:PilZ domain-containing protein [bacterium]|nr:PilZ domain-containing protein [bacterium]
MNKIEDPNQLFVHERVVCRAELDGRIFSFSTEIVDVIGKGLFISHPDLAEYEIEEGQEILVRYFRKDAAYQFLSRVIGIEESTGPLFLLIAFPARITRLQRRKYIRATMDGSVLFRSDIGEKSPMQGELLSISLGGLQMATPRTGIFSDRFKPVGRNLSMAISPEKWDSFNAMGTIKRVYQDPESLTWLRVQVEFTSLDSAIKNKLVELILKYAD